MTTLSFAGTTIWNDASTGVGVLRVFRDGSRVDWLVERIPGGSGKVAKNIGTDPGRLDIQAHFLMADSTADTLRGSVQNLQGSYGQVVINAGSLGTTTISNCIMRNFGLIRGAPVRYPAGTVLRDFVFVFTFEVLA